MFIEVHETKDSNNNDLKITFLKSLNVQAFPCGRRRSELIEVDTNGDGQTKDNEKYNIPFDPEARLNTEANNRRHSSLNGFTQTYVKSKWLTDGSDLLSLVMQGYLFNIKLDSGHQTAQAFGAKIIESLGDTTATKIYANIRLEEVPLYTGFTTYKTSVLRNQSEELSLTIDLLSAQGRDNDKYLTDPKSYFYFAGLSFSTSPVSGNNDSTPYKDINTTTGELQQQVISLQILERANADADTVWEPCQAAYLPEIKHGKTENSIEIGTISATDIVLREDSEVFKVPSLKLEKCDAENTYKMVFSAASIVEQS